MTPGDRSQGWMETEFEEDRRRFLASCGRFAAITPPALTILLSTSLNTEAIARSGGGVGWGDHHHRRDHDRDHDQDDRDRR
jgi:hypothetical protein